MAASNESNFSAWLQRVRQTGEFSDVIVEANGKEFYLHMLPLLNASSFFRTLPSSSRGFRYDSPARVVMPDFVAGAEAFSIAADFCYLIKPNITLQNVAQIRAAAEYLGMQDLLESTKKFLYTHIFSQWRASITFLQNHQRLGSLVDEYVESRCLASISTACAQAFFDIIHLSAPIPLHHSGSPKSWLSSPSQTLADILVTTCSLRDEFVAVIVDELVNAEVNLNLECRQGRDVKGWLHSTITTECRTNRARCWVVICLTMMLQKSVDSERPWLELSSQYWCSLLQHVGSCMKTEESEEIMERLNQAKAFLEQRIGGSLHELDDYLLAYKFEPRTLLSLVKQFRKVQGLNQKEIEEVAAEVDSCLWNFVDNDCVSANDVIYLIESFPPSARESHDLLYAAIEKVLARGENFSPQEKQNLWRLVQVSKLSPPHNDSALNNPILLCQPQVLEYVLRQHSQELEKSVEREDSSQNLWKIMNKLLKASLKLLEENSRRSMEITELQRQYTELIGSRVPSLRYCSDSSSDVDRPTLTLLNDSDEIEELSSTCSSCADY